MHQNGINTRHIGLLRCQFWRKINGSVHLSSGSPIVCTHFNILYTGIQPGYKVRFGADVTRYVISKEQYYPNKFRLEQRFRGKSSLHTDLYVGNISNDDNCDLDTRYDKLPPPTVRYILMYIGESNRDCGEV